MRRLLVVLGATVMVGVTPGQRALGDPTFPQGDARRSMGNLGPRQPLPSPQGSSADREPGYSLEHGQHHAHRRWSRGFYHPYLGGAYRNPAVYDPRNYWQGWYGYPYPYGPDYYDPYYLPPLYLPAEGLYGPQALRRFMGWDNWYRPAPNINIIVPPGGADRQADAAEDKKPNLRGTNQRSLALAWKFIGHGDAHFGNQKYTNALQQYRKAVRAAPQLAAGYFRQAYALMATGRHELAAKAIKRGLGFDPGWAASDFKNGDLYGENKLAKNAHLDAMAEAAEQKPHDADLLFLLGVYLHFDGQPDRAAVFFQQAARLTGGDDAHLKAFLRIDD